MGLTAGQHVTCGQASERAKARATSHGGVGTELAVGAANGVVVNNGTAIHQDSLVERGMGIDHSARENHRARAELRNGTQDPSGMQQHCEGNGHLLKHLEPGLTEGRIANGYNHLIGWGLTRGIKKPFQIPAKRQATQYREYAHQSAFQQGLIEIPHDVMATENNDITNGAAMATGSKD